MVHWQSMVSVNTIQNDEKVVGSLRILARKTLTYNKMQTLRYGEMQSYSVIKFFAIKLQMTLIHTRVIAMCCISPKY